MLRSRLVMRSASIIVPMLHVMFVPGVLLMLVVVVVRDGGVVVVLVDAPSVFLVRPELLQVVLRLQVAVVEEAVGLSLYV